MSDNSASGSVSPVDGGVYMGGEQGGAGDTGRRPPAAAQSLPEGARWRPHRPAGELVRAERVSSLDGPPDDLAAAPPTKPAGR